MLKIIFKYVIIQYTLLITNLQDIINLKEEYKKKKNEISNILTFF